MTAEVDCVVAGAGAVGLAVARALAQSGREVLVLESAAAIGTETSSRNSEVIHAGIYYPTGSLKARLCVAGKEALYRFCAERDDARLFVNLPHLAYWSLLSAARLLLGNSSSGIMETASLELPTVNIGMRQQGRERAANIVDAPAEARAILEAIDAALATEFKEGLRGMSNPYGDGRAAERIRDVLLTTPLGESLLLKQARQLDAD